MPLEIRELHIRVNLGGPSANGGAQDGQNPSSSQGAGQGGDELVAKCVEEVLRVLRERNER